MTTYDNIDDATLTEMDERARDLIETYIARLKGKTFYDDYIKPESVKLIVFYNGNQFPTHFHPLPF